MGDGADRFRVVTARRFTLAKAAPDSDRRGNDAPVEAAGFARLRARAGRVTLLLLRPSSLFSLFRDRSTLPRPARERRRSNDMRTLLAAVARALAATGRLTAGVGATSIHALRAACAARKDEAVVTTVSQEPASQNDRSRDTARLSAELEAALLRELRGTYDEINGTFFRRKLRPAAIALSDTSSRLGRWILNTRTIEIARPLLVSKPWGVIVEVLKHEMAHQFVHEVLEQTDETAHGPAFRALCEKLGIDGSAAGMPETGAPTGEEARVLERIARLLALAESSNVNEAQAAMNAAQRLMLKYNLESAADRTRGYAFRYLGKPSGRVTEGERLLGTILGSHFFVQVIWVPVYRPLEQKRGTVLEVCGTQANLEMAAYVHAFLSHTAEHLWQEHKRSHGIRGDRDRRTFIAGVMSGFLDKLRAQQKVNKEQGLVWVGDADLDGFYRKRHPRISLVRNAGSRRTEAHAHGREAGRRIVLHKPVQGTSGGTVRLLPR